VRGTRRTGVLIPPRHTGVHVVPEGANTRAVGVWTCGQPQIVLGALGPSCHMAEPWVYCWVPFVLRALGYACILTLPHFNAIMHLVLSCLTVAISSSFPFTFIKDDSEISLVDVSASLCYLL
jgi:hypothetical protein